MVVITRERAGEINRPIIRITPMRRKNVLVN